MDVAMEVTGLGSIREYVRRWHAKFADYVAGRPIYKLCTSAERMEGSIRLLRWREK